MNIWKPAPNKVQTLSVDNPQYWALCVHRSKYTKEQILFAIEEIKLVNDEWHQFLSYAYSFLSDEHGEMSYISGFATDNHEKLYAMLSKANGYVYPNFSENSHANCFPVGKWLREVNQTRNEIKRIKNFISKNFYAEANNV